jgi:hypothetical protein
MLYPLRYPFKFLVYAMMPPAPPTYCMPISVPSVFVVVPAFCDFYAGPLPSFLLRFLLAASIILILNIFFLFITHSLPHPPSTLLKPLHAL